MRTFRCPVHTTYAEIQSATLLVTKAIDREGHQGLGNCVEKEACDSLENDSKLQPKPQPIARPFELALRLQSALMPKAIRVGYIKPYKTISGSVTFLTLTIINL